MLELNRHFNFIGNNLIQRFSKKTFDFFFKKNNIFIIIESIEVEE